MSPPTVRGRGRNICNDFGRAASLCPDRVKARASLPGKRLVETFAGKSRVARHLGHALGASNISEGLCNKCRIPGGFLDAGFKVSRHLLRTSKMLDIVSCR